MSRPEGFVAPGFEALAAELERQVRATGGGAAVAAYHRGEPVVDLWAGVRDRDGHPWTRDTACVSFSTTKGVASTALHMLVDRGQVDVDAPVARYWPEFAAAGKGAISVRDVLCHRAGLYDVRSLLDDARQLCDWDFVVNALAAASPRPSPPGASAYQALTYGHMVGEILRRVTGRTVTDFVSGEIARPLGVDTLWIGAPDAAISGSARLMLRGPSKREGGRRPNRRWNTWGAVERLLRAAGHPFELRLGKLALAPRGISSFDFSSPEVLRACIPAANGLFTARALARFYAVLAGGGSRFGVRLLGPETLARATQIQVRGFDQVLLFKMGWRLGYHMVPSFEGVLPRAFGHFGWGGSGAWADPERDLSFGYVVNAGTGTPVGDLRILRLSTLLLDAVRAHHGRPHTVRSAVGSLVYRAAGMLGPRTAEGGV